MRSPIWASSTHAAQGDAASSCGPPPSSGPARSDNTADKLRPPFPRRPRAPPRPPARCPGAPPGRRGGYAAPLRPAPPQPRAAARPPSLPFPSPPAPPRPVSSCTPSPGPGRSRAAEQQDRAMSHGARVIRTGVSSAGPAAPPSAAASSAGSDAELVDGAYFRSCSGMLKVAQMVRSRAGAGGLGTLGPPLLRGGGKQRFLL